jgi:hypothetical protein
MQSKPEVAKEEPDEEYKYKLQHVDYVRTSVKPVYFGMEDQVYYFNHHHNEIKGFLTNLNNK